MVQLHGLEEGRTAVRDWKELAERDKMADCAIIATQDKVFF